MVRIALMMGIAGLAAQAASAQSARLHVTTDSLFVGEPFRIEVVVERPPIGEVAFPLPPTGQARITSPLQAGDAELVSLRRHPPSTNAADLRIDRATYEAVVFEIDSAVVGPIPAFHVVGGDTSLILAPARTIPVRSVTDAEARELMPPAPLASFERSLWPWLLLGLAMLLGLGVVVWTWRRRRGIRHAAAADPADVALRRLNDLGDEPPPVPQLVKPFYAEVADVVRRYLEDRTGLPALETTSRELLQHLERQPTDVPYEVVAELRSLLSTADLVKFADAVPETDRHRRAIDEARHIVTLTESAILARERAASDHPQ